MIKFKTAIHLYLYNKKCIFCSCILLPDKTVLLLEMLREIDVCLIERNFIDFVNVITIYKGNGNTNMLT